MLRMKMKLRKEKKVKPKIVGPRSRIRARQPETPRGRVSRPEYLVVDPRSRIRPTD